MKSKIGIIGFGQKPQIEVFQKASKELRQSPEYSYEKVFDQLWSKIESEINVDLNKKGRNYAILPILKKAKIIELEQKGMNISSTMVKIYRNMNEDISSFVPFF